MAKFYLALLWHQHQPVYKNTAQPTQQGSYLHPWVRLHALRDYYSMAALAAAHPGVHLTINLAASLLLQLEDYLERGATDQQLELTLKPAESLTGEEREQVLGGFFDAHWHNQIFVHPRYKELFEQRLEGRPFTDQDLRDLQMWSNLAWFGLEFRQGEVHLATGEVASVQRFVEQGRGFSIDDIEAMVAEQIKILKGVVPIHRLLQKLGQIEVTTTPFYHPILPLLVDTDQATIDRPGSTHPPRFKHPEDAEAQVRLAAEYYWKCFGRSPRGMWPAEGAVSQSVIPLFAQHGMRWIATDRGVLSRSGRWGYNVEDPNVLCQPYRAEEGKDILTVFFRDTQLSDAIGFHYYAYSDYIEAAHDFLRQIKERFAYRLAGGEDRVLTVALDGENAWGAYRDDGRPFLHALYDLLERDVDIETVTFAEYVEGNPARGISPHPIETQTKVYNLFTASWIDENGSAPGVDLGTWIGEPEENRGWELLGQARDELNRAGATPESAPAAFDALYIAEGSDWFWWFGEDQDSGNDQEFDDLFRTHLKNVYRALNQEPPEALESHIVAHKVVWTFTRPVERIQRQDHLSVVTNCPGLFTWWLNDGPLQSAEMIPVGGVMAGAQHHQLPLGPFSADARVLHLRFLCMDPACDRTNICCRQDEYSIIIQ
ncbi:MAG TPA: glycoside hydrolase family 57 protein [Anaerolineales bacterium]